ncbi:MAG: hypothetical protein V3T31_02165, partial [candidate division Zixibacteria bacterium]
NAYLEANVVRDVAIGANPSFPSLMNNDFPVTVNRTDGYCPGNAWYSPGEQSINFCQAGGQYPNTAWSSVVHHEYGHHLVNMGGSGQSEYGEGMGDCMSVLTLDTSALGIGFFGTCDESLRDADNSLQYPCGGTSHFCGQLISGCVWDTRNALMITEPTDYLEILAAITVNSILLHVGGSITPQITIDFLTLDDNDASIDNGTPHYWEIAAGFGAHSMDAPQLILLTFELAEPAPSILDPGQTTSFELTVTGQSGGVPVEGTGKLFYSVDGSPIVEIAMTELSANHYTGDLPGLDCFTDVSFYFSADEAGFGAIYYPGLTDPFQALVATEEVTLLEESLDIDPGWTTEGDWAFGQPTGAGGEYGYADPASAYTGNNVYGFNLTGDYGNNLSELHLTSSAIDCSGMAGVKFKFFRWLGVEQPAYDHAYVKVSNNGVDWVEVWANPSEMTDAEWTEVEYDISAVADEQSTVYLRWTMGTTDGSWRYCGWNIDDVSVRSFKCIPWICGDVNGVDGGPDIADLTFLVNFLFVTFEPPPILEAANVNGADGVDIVDLTHLVNFLFMEGPPPNCP